MSRQLSSILVDAVLVRILLDAREYSILVNALAALLLRSMKNTWHIVATIIIRKGHIKCRQQHALHAIHSLCILRQLTTRLNSHIEKFDRLRPIILLDGGSA